jgi:replicative DNA helicase
MSTLDKLEEEDAADGTIKPFKSLQEEAIISLAIDFPDFFSAVVNYLKPELFSRPETSWVIAEILNIYEKYNVIPTRGILKEHLETTLTVDDPYEEILSLVDRKSNHREVPIVKDLLLKWAKQKAFGLLYKSDAIAAYQEGNFEYIQKLFDEANKIVDIGDHSGLWLFENLEVLFKTDIVEHKTTGFPRLDKLLNNGGPSPKEVVCFLAPTNVGKSILLCNVAMSSYKGYSNGILGQDVLFITYELDVIKTALRCIASATNIPIDSLNSHQDLAVRTLKALHNTYNKRIYFHEWAPDECSVDHIYQLLANLKRTQGWKPDVIIIDYMDLMVSRYKQYNKDDYGRLKHVATEIRGLAKNENSLVYTATQTNRGGMDAALIDLNKSSESFGKQFALDYIISLNQSMDERTQDPPQIRMFIAKNRNGPKHETITCDINYKTMLVTETKVQSLNVDSADRISTNARQRN